MGRHVQVLPDPSCGTCEGEGSLYFFFKNLYRHLIRTTSVSCPECYPYYKGGAKASDDEVDIKSQESCALFDQGWLEDSDG